MSKDLAHAYGVHVTSFAGGVGRGPCVQIDDADNVIQLTRVQAEFVRDVLSKWLAGWEDR